MVSAVLMHACAHAAVQLSKQSLKNKSVVHAASSGNVDRHEAGRPLVLAHNRSDAHPYACSPQLNQPAVT